MGDSLLKQINNTFITGVAYRNKIPKLLYLSIRSKNY